MERQVRVAKSLGEPFWLEQDDTSVNIGNEYSFLKRRWSRDAVELNNTNSQMYLLVPED